MFSSTRLQRPLPGQLGCQLFFTEGDRPFCLYVVAGSRAYLPAHRRRGQRRARRPGDRPVIAAPPKETFSERVVRHVSTKLRPAIEPPQLPREVRGRRFRARGQPAAVPVASGYRVRRGVRSGGRLRIGLDRVLLLGEQRRERVPARIDPGRLVEDRQLVVLRRRTALHPRLQRDVRRVRLREQRHLRAGLLQLRLPLRHELVRPTATLLQPVPLRPVPSGARVRRTGRVPRRDLRAAVAVGSDVHDGRARPRTRPRCTPRRVSKLRPQPPAHRARRCHRPRRARRRAACHASSASKRRRPATATGWPRPTAASSASATRRSSARPAA